MNPLHKALYRSFLNSDSEPDERQERIINAELARCLIYLYWFNFILLLIMFAHDRLEGIFMSTVTIVLLINFAFVMIFTLTNEHCQELRGQEIDITLQSLPQYLEYHKKWAIIFGAHNYYEFRETGICRISTVELHSLYIQLWTIDGSVLLSPQQKRGS